MGVLYLYYNNKTTNKMTYSKFVQTAIETADLTGVTKEDMQFAYATFFSTFGETVTKAIESVKLLNSFNY